MRQAFAWFWNFTSFAGLTQCREADNKVSKTAWFILALLGYGLTWYTASNTIKTFFQAKTDTKILFTTGTGFKTKINFPSVTVCNSNRIHCGHLYDLILNCTKVNDILLKLF